MYPVINKLERLPKRQSQVDNPDKLTTHGTQN